MPTATTAKTTTTKRTRRPRKSTAVAKKSVRTANGSKTTSKTTANPPTVTTETIKDHKVVSTRIEIQRPTAPLITMEAYMRDWPNRWNVHHYEMQELVKDLGYPVMIRAAYTLGGKGGGVAHNEYELDEIVIKGIANSLTKQVLIEEYLGDWKQIEYEIMRDADGNCVTVCNMENVLGMKVHTGDNIVCLLYTSPSPRDS